MMASCTPSPAELCAIFEENVRLKEVGPAIGSLLTKYTLVARNAFAPLPEPGERDLLTDYFTLVAELSGPSYSVDDLVQGTESFLLAHQVKIPEY